MNKRKLRKLIFFVGLLLIILGLYLVIRVQIESRLQPSPSDSAAVLEDFRPLDATYILDGQAIAFKDGQNADKSITIFGEPAFGDLNGDGRNDAAVLLFEDSVGSGSFFYVAAALNLSTGAQGTEAIFLGDRIAPQNLAIKDGQIAVNYADRRAGEAMATPPSVGVSAYFSIKDGVLQKIEASAKIDSYLVSDEDATKYCNGAEMDSEGYRQTINIIKPLITTEANPTLKQTISAVINAATTGNCQQVAGNFGISGDGSTVYIAPIDAWAGVSIAMCSCQPQVEVNLLRLPGIKKVTWLPAVSNFEECAALSGAVMESYPRQCRYGEQNFTENIGNELEQSDNIILDYPRPNQNISSPLTVKGRARGSWFFEASFPIVLTDWDGKIIAQGIAQAQGDWMTSDFVPFEATLSFTADKSAYSNRGSLILKKDNPSGLASLDAALEIPVMIAAE
ncbi:MAG: Gmad2 immunoglobulin-like domain-containing protein [Patescibacteria group bacterium]|nr:Gmad2 immunoglobulin-like domain-containing protein [Patescibacteria group bacterium]